MNRHPFTSCAKGNGPFTSCTVLEGYLLGSCANCHYGPEGTRCNFRKYSFLLSLHSLTFVLQLNRPKGRWQDTNTPVWIMVAGICQSITQVEENILHVLEPTPRNSDSVQDANHQYRIGQQQSSASLEVLVVRMLALVNGASNSARPQEVPNAKPISWNRLEMDSSCYAVGIATSSETLFNPEPVSRGTDRSSFNSRYCDLISHHPKDGRAQKRSTNSCAQEVLDKICKQMGKSWDKAILQFHSATLQQKPSASIRSRSFSIHVESCAHVVLTWGPPCKLVSFKRSRPASNEIEAWVTRATMQNETVDS